MVRKETVYTRPFSAPSVEIILLPEGAAGKDIE